MKVICRDCRHPEEVHNVDGKGTCACCHLCGHFFYASHGRTQTCGPRSADYYRKRRQSKDVRDREKIRKYERDEANSRTNAQSKSAKR